MSRPEDDRARLRDHIIAAQADALRLQDNNPWWAGLRRNDAVHLKARLRRIEGGTHVA